MNNNLEDFHTENPELTLEYIENLKRSELESEMEEVYGVDGNQDISPVKSN
jgi:hypothetical protein